MNNGKVTNDEVKQKAIEIIQKAARKFRVPMYAVTASQFWACANDNVTDWQMRKIGSFTRVRNTEFPVPPGAEKVEQSQTYKKFIGRISNLSNFNCHNVPIEELFKISGVKKSTVFKMLVIPDMHIDEHDEYALCALLKFVQKYKPHGVINLGDFMEMDAVTHWPAPDARPRRLTPQILKARKILTTIDDACGPQCKFKKFLMGNHEDWLNQYLVGNIPEALFELDQLGVDLRFQELLGLKDFGYDTIPLNEILKIGEHSHFIHGYYTNKHHAAKHLDVFGVNIYYGHLHDIQHHSTVSVNGVHEAASLGCLRKLNAPFLRGKPNNWSHAFGIFEYTFDGFYTRYTPVIINGKFSYNGEVFDGTKL